MDKITKLSLCCLSETSIRNTGHLSLACSLVHHRQQAYLTYSIQMAHDSSTACNKSQMCRTDYMPVTHAEYTSLLILDPSLELVQVSWIGYGIARNPEGRRGTD